MSGCMWGAVSKLADDCPRDAVLIAYRAEVVDAAAGPASGIVVYPLCGVHGARASEDYRVSLPEVLDELRRLHPGRVWVAERESDAA